MKLSAGDAEEGEPEVASISACARSTAPSPPLAWCSHTTALAAPAASAATLTASSSASESVANLLIATTTGRPKALQLAMWRLEVLAPFCDERDVLPRVGRVERLSRGHGGAAAVHLERADGRDQHGRVGQQPRRAALDVDKLLEADVGAKPRLGDDEPALPHELEPDVVGQHGGVAVRDVGKGARVHEHGRRFQRLHQRRLDRVAHQHGQRAADAEVVGRDGRARLGRGDDHRAQPLAHVPQARSSAPARP